MNQKSKKDIYWIAVLLAGVMLGVVITIAVAAIINYDPKLGLTLLGATWSEVLTAIGTFGAVLFSLHSVWTQRKEKKVLEVYKARERLVKQLVEIQSLIRESIEARTGSAERKGLFLAGLESRMKKLYDPRNSLVCPQYNKTLGEIAYIAEISNCRAEWEELTLDESLERVRVCADKLKRTIITSKRKLEDDCPFLEL